MAKSKSAGKGSFGGGKASGGGDMGVVKRVAAGPVDSKGGKGKK